MIKYDESARLDQMAGEFGEDRCEPMTSVEIRAESVVAATEVLRKGMPGTDHPYQPSYAGHRPQPGRRYLGLDVLADPTSPPSPTQSRPPRRSPPPTAFPRSTFPRSTHDPQQDHASTVKHHARGLDLIFS
jgi:hypothetical protein